MTLVFLGATPEFRATLRASVPLSNFFLRTFLICPPNHERATHCRYIPYSTIRKLLPDDSTIPGTHLKTNMQGLARLTVAGDSLSDITVM
jgi:hypothetical protein